LLQYSFQALWVEVVGFIPQLVVAIVILIVGWIVGAALKRIIESIFKTLRINALLDAAGVDTLASRTGYALDAGAFVGALVKWFVIIVFFVAALDVVHLDQVTLFLREVVLTYLPEVIVAVLILFGAMIVANFAHASVVAGARAANFGSPELLGNFARYAIIVFAVLAALNQLHIAPQLVQMLFAGFVFAASLALGLAFGLGGREAAAHYIDKVRRGENR
jgi:hypothetical protein